MSQREQSAVPVVAVVLAAGFGTRFDPNNPKQLVSVGGKPIVCWSIEAFETNPRITDIVVVVNPQVRDAVERLIDEAGYQAGENLYINAHGTGTHLNDSTETRAIKVALGEEEARRASVSSTKSMHGHMFGATGAVELIASALALRDGIVPPTIGLEEADPECDLDYTPLEARKRDLDIAISNSLGFGGHNVCVALRRV